jgi:hypothetical protein
MNYLELIPPCLRSRLDIDQDHDTAFDLFVKLSILHHQTEEEYHLLETYETNASYRTSPAVALQIGSTLEHLRRYRGIIESGMVELDNQIPLDRDRRNQTFIDALLRDVNALQATLLPDEVDLSLLLVTRVADSSRDTFHQSALSYFPNHGHGVEIGGTSTQSSVEFRAVFLLACRKHCVDDMILHRYEPCGTPTHSESIRETFPIQDPEKYPTIQAYREAHPRYLSGHFRNCVGLTLHLPTGGAGTRKRGHWSPPSLSERCIWSESNTCMVIVEQSQDGRCVRVRLASSTVLARCANHWHILHHDDFRHPVMTMYRNPQGLYDSLEHPGILLRLSTSPSMSYLDGGH